MRVRHRDRVNARRATRAMRRVLKRHGLKGRESSQNDWQETWTATGARGHHVSVVLSRLPAAGNAEAEVSFTAPRRRAGALFVTYSPTELEEVVSRIMADARISDSAGLMGRYA